jgi:hypothetical protein
MLRVCFGGSVLTVVRERCMRRVKFGAVLMCGLPGMYQFSEAGERRRLSESMISEEFKFIIQTLCLIHCQC